MGVEISDSQDVSSSGFEIPLLTETTLSPPAASLMFHKIKTGLAGLLLQVVVVVLLLEPGRRSLELEDLSALLDEEVPHGGQLLSHLIQAPHPATWTTHCTLYSIP
jgi:hypothetical protein